MAGRSAKNPLFHVLVTLGVAAGLEACGGMSESDAGSAGGTGGTSATTAPLCPSSCASAGDFVCSDPVDRSTCRCEEARPTGAASCANKFQFRCSAYVPSDCTDTASTARTGCYCDETALTPEDCASTTQFICERYYPEPETCGCDTTRPLSAADCIPPQDAYFCRYSNPDVDCQCLTAIPIR
jgi:hypothetical protein